MGKFDKFKGKGKSAKGHLVKINKYDSKTAVLDLISYIATAKDEFDLSRYFKPLYDTIYNDFLGFKNDCKYDVTQSELSSLETELDEVVINLEDKLESSHGVGTVTIAVGGGYSSGKSSFLNKITGSPNLLPTGVEPVSIVNTSLTFSKNTKNLIIRGKNIKDAYIHLNKDVLECIQHSSKSKVYVTSVLESLLIDIPTTEDIFDRVTLVDTPGYNNSTAKNEENSRSDMETAVQAMIDADAFIWCIDSEAGTIPTKDINLINQILEDGWDKPYVIVFTKRDKKDLASQQKIIIESLKTAQKNLNKMPYSILGFSSIEDSPYLIANGKDIPSFIQELKSDLNKSDVKASFLNTLEVKINDAILSLQEENKEFEEERKSLSEKKSDLHNQKRDTSDFSKTNKENLEELIIDNYTAMIDSIDEHRSLIGQLFDLVEEGFGRESEWREKKGVLSDVSSISNRLHRARNIYDAMEYPDYPEVYSEDFRNTVLETFVSYCDNDIQDITEYQKELTERYKTIVEVKREIERTIKLLREFLPKIKNVGSTCFEAYLKDAKKYYMGCQIQEESFGDIFSAIASDNVKRFTGCLSSGVDFSVCNKQGYNPLTYVAHCGNNEMMKYLIDHDVDLSLKDNNGYTAFETAVINHYRDICEMILKKDPTAKFTDTPLEELYSRNNFMNWIKSV